MQSGDSNAHRNWDIQGFGNKFRDQHGLLSGMCLLTMLAYQTFMILLVLAYYSLVEVFLINVYGILK